MDPIQIVTDSVNAMTTTLLEKSPKLALGLLIIVLTWIAAKIAGTVISRMLNRANLRESLVVLFVKIARIGVWILGLLIATMTVFPSFTPAEIITTLGLSSIAIGFAFKDIFENFIAGILILLREPFRLGDYIECGGHEGTVENITVRDTHIREPNANRVVLPNAMLFKNPVRVFTDRKTRRITIVCGVAYSEDLSHARQVIADAVSHAPTVNTAQPVQIYAKEFGASSVDFEVTWWTGTESDGANIRVSRDSVIEAVKTALDKAGIEIPFPYRTLTFSEPLELRNKTA